MNEIATDIAIVVASSPAIVFADARKAEQLFDHIEAEIAAFVPDLTTVTGRKAIASLAYKVTRTKTAIDNAGADLNETARKQINAVDAERRKFRTRLDALSEKARKPLTDWEVIEKARIAECERIVEAFGEVGVVSVHDTAETVQKRWQIVKDSALDPALLQDYLPIAEMRREDALASLDSAFARLTKEEADKAELEQLRAAERKRQDEEAAAKAEEQRLFNQRIEEQRRAKTAEEEVARVAAAAEQARKDAEEKAEADRLAAEQRHANELAEAKRQNQAVIDAAAQKERDREEEAARAAAAQAARDADQQHRAEVLNAARDAIMGVAGIGKDKAEKVVLAIAAGQIPSVAVRF